MNELIEKHLLEFEMYYSLLSEWNQKFNLTTVEDRESVFLRHFEDSIAAAPFIKQGASLCDIGSGAGFPGLPLKIVRPDITAALFDSVNKKVSFLREVISKLGLTGITAEHIRAEDAAAPNRYRESFDAVTARAVAPLPVLCEYSLPLLKTGGVFIAYKTAASAETEISAAQNALKALGGRVADTVYYSLKTNPCRDNSQFIIHNSQLKDNNPLFVLIIIEKVASSPLKYPRGGNKPRTTPL